MFRAVRKIVTSVALLSGVGLGLLFGYFFAVSAESEGAARAKEAMSEAGAAVAEQGAAALVRARLVTTFGLDGARFLHVYFDDGRAWVYGFPPAGVAVGALEEQIQDVPGVRSVEMHLFERPAGLPGAEGLREGP